MAKGTTIKSKIKNNKYLKGMRNFLKYTSQKESKYVRFSTHKKIKKNVVFYSSYRTKIMAGNPYAIFKYLYGNPEYKHLIHVWVLGNESLFETDRVKYYANFPNVKFVLNNSDEHMEYFATAEYLVNNAALPTYFQKRPGQTYINTWHGTPLKTLGNHMHDGKMSSVSNMQRNLFFCDYFVMPNKYTADIMMDAYGMHGMFDGSIVDVGYPRNDLVLNTEKEKVLTQLENKLQESLEGKKIILYAPTFRTSSDQKVDSTAEMSSYMKELVANVPEDYVVVFKVHNMLSQYFKDNSYISNRMLFDEFETNELLSVVDILITDYSSVFFDFLCTRKPIIFFTYDLEEYERERGLYLPHNDLPGAVCKTTKEVLDSVVSIDNGQYDYEDKYQNFVNRFAYNDDGKATERLVDIVFKGKETDATYKIKDDRRKILIRINRLRRNQASELCIQYLKEIDFTKYKVTVVCENDYRTRKILKQINPDITTITVVGKKLMLSPTELILNKFSPVKVKNTTMAPAYNREFIRRFGETEFERIIDFEGNSLSWYMIFENGTCSNLTIAIHRENRVTDFLLKNKSEKISKFIITDSSLYNKFSTKNDVSGEIEYRDVNDLPGITEQLMKVNVMNVLFLAGFDSTNYVFVNLIKALKERGHNCTVIIKDPNDQINNKMFFEAGINTISYKKIRRSSIKNYDIVFSAPVIYKVYNKIYKEIYKKKIFVISFATLFSSVAMRVHPDLVLSIGEEKFDEFKEENLRYSLIAIGNPQYDKLVEEKKLRQKDPNNIKKVLIIDQGGYPYGHKGKKQLADVLTNIAKNNSDKEFYIKPRYVPSEKGQTLHSATQHLYDYFVDIPNNLILIDYPTNLESLILDFDAVITTWSTAYLDAAVLDLPLLLIEGLDSVDVFDVRTNRINKAYEILKGTGCVVHYKDLYDKKVPFKRVNKEYLQRNVYEPDEPATPRIINLLEFLYKNLLVYDKRIFGFYKTTVHEFYDQFDNIEVVSKKQQKYIIWKKMFNNINAYAQQFVYENRCMGNVLPTKAFNEVWEHEITDESPKVLSTELSTLYGTIGEQIKADFFQNNQEKINANTILQDYFFQWLYNKEQYDSIMHFNGNISAPESLNYYKGLICLKRGETQKGLDHILEFLKIINEKECIELRKEKFLHTNLSPVFKKVGVNTVFALMYENNLFKLILRISSEKLDKNNCVAYYKMLVYNRLCFYDEAIQYYAKHQDLKRKLKRYREDEFSQLAEEQLQISNQGVEEHESKSNS